MHEVSGSVGPVSGHASVGGGCTSGGVSVFGVSISFSAGSCKPAPCQNKK